AAAPFPGGEAPSSRLLQLEFPARERLPTRSFEVDARLALPLHPAEEEVEGAAEALLEFGFRLQAVELADRDRVEPDLKLVARLHVAPHVGGVEAREAVALPVGEVDPALRFEDRVDEALHEASLALPGGERIEEFHLRPPPIRPRHATVEAERASGEGRGEPRPDEPPGVGEVLRGDPVDPRSLLEDPLHLRAGPEGIEVLRDLLEGDPREDVVEEDAGRGASRKLVRSRLDHHPLTLDPLLLPLDAAEAPHPRVRSDDESEVRLPQCGEGLVSDLLRFEFDRVSLR